MPLNTYGAGANGPGHCFHQHLTFYLRFAGNGLPPSAAYYDYVLRWDDLWAAITARVQMFDAAAGHFSHYTEATDCFERFGLDIQRVPFQALALIPHIETAHAHGDVLLAAVDTYYLPSFVEYMRVHGLTICALLDAAANGQIINLWHWENSASTPTATLVRSIQEQGSKIWKLHLKHDHQLHPYSIYTSTCKAHAILATGSEQKLSTYCEALERMINEDPPMPVDPAEKAILFHVPYRRLSNGNFRTTWLLRSAANRLMHVRGGLEELFLWIADVLQLPQAQNLARQAHESFVKWKTLNVLCARYDLGAARTLPKTLFQQLNMAVEADRNLGLACETELATSIS